MHSALRSLHIPSLLLFRYSKQKPRLAFFLCVLETTIVTTIYVLCTSQGLNGRSQRPSHDHPGQLLLVQR